ncbi:hypothetical protein Tco_0565326 [Tanacetum coccineum]
MAVIWNHTLRKSIGIVISISKAVDIVVGFGVCPDTSDPKLVKIIVDEITSMWEVDAFTLNTRVWKIVYTSVPFKWGELSWLQVFVNGVIYFHACDSIYLDDGVRSNFVILFDLKSEKFGEVCLPERLVHAPLLRETKVNESLGLLEYYIEGGKYVCDRVVGFRNNGEVVMELLDDDIFDESGIEVYEPLSGHTNGVGINGESSVLKTNGNGPRYHFIRECVENEQVIVEHVSGENQRVNEGLGAHKVQGDEIVTWCARATLFDSEIQRVIVGEFLSFGCGWKACYQKSRNPSSSASPTRPILFSI